MLLSSCYYYVPDAITVNPIDAGQPSYRMHVNVKSGARIRVCAALDESIGYDDTLEYRSWALVGYNTRFSSAYTQTNAAQPLRVPMYIYARLNAAVRATDGMIVFSPYKYTVRGEVYTEDDKVEQSSNPADFYKDLEEAYDPGNSVEFMLDPTVDVEDETQFRRYSQANVNSEGEFELKYLYIRIGYIATNGAVTLVEGSLGTDKGYDQGMESDQYISKRHDDEADHTYTFKGLQLKELLAIGKGVIRGIANSAALWVKDGISDTIAATTAWVYKYFLPSHEDASNNGHNLEVGSLEVVAKTPTVWVPKTDDQGNQLLDDDGNPIYEEVEDTSAPHRQEGVWFGGKDKFVDGFGGSGAAIYKDGDNNWQATFDFLTVRHALKATSIEIDEVYYVGGQQISSAAGCTLDYVEAVLAADDSVDYYRCYFRAVDSDGRRIHNQWRVYDQAYCNTFNLESPAADGAYGNHFYWRLVVGVSTETVPLDGEEGEFHYIDLSNRIKVGTYKDFMVSEGLLTDYNQAPESDDKVVLLGYNTDEDVSIPGKNRIDNPADRQSCIVTAAAGTGAPYIFEIVGIKTFSIPAPAIKIKPGDNYFSGTMVIGPGSTIVDNDGNEVSPGQLTPLPEDVEGLKNRQNGLETIINNIQQSRVNLLRNSGFVGDYVSVTLQDKDYINDNDSLYSPSFVHWSYENVEGLKLAEDSYVDGVDATTEALVKTGYLKQRLYYRILAGTTYTLSVYVNGAVGSKVKLIVQSGEAEAASKEFTIDATGYHRITYTFTPSQQADSIRISTSANVYILAPQLEKGSVATAWTPSLMDNGTDVALFESMANIRAALGQRTTINGGVILTSIIGCGYEDASSTWDCHAGINGINSPDRTDDDSIAFWAGGTLEGAINLRNACSSTIDEKIINSISNDSSYAKYAVLHNGTTILSKAIVYGDIYAKNGYFQGEVHATSGEFTGKVTATSGTFKGRIEANEGFFKGDITGSRGTFSGAVNIADGAIKFNENGSGSLAGGGIQWGISGEGLIIDGDIRPTKGFKYTPILYGTNNAGVIDSPMAIWTDDSNGTLQLPARIGLHGLQIVVVNASESKDAELTIAIQSGDDSNIIWREGGNLQYKKSMTILAGTSATFIYVGDWYFVARSY